MVQQQTALLILPRFRRRTPAPPPTLVPRSGGSPPTTTNPPKNPSVPPSPPGLRKKSVLPRPLWVPRSRHGSLLLGRELRLRKASWLRLRTAALALFRPPHARKSSTPATTNAKFHPRFRTFHHLRHDENSVTRGGTLQPVLHPSTAVPVLRPNCYGDPSTSI